jgi:hypothetical protein
MTTKIKTSKAKTKGRPFKMFYVGKEWDIVFLLPPPAFKLWVFYYRLEGVKREGWAPRDTISEKCDMDKDAVTKWRQYLVANGWMRKIGDHATPGNPLATTPIMQVCRGTIPPAGPDGRGKSKASRDNLKRGRKVSAAVETESIRYRPVRKVSAASGDGCSENAVSETFRRNVDKNHVDKKPDVDGPVKRKRGVGSLLKLNTDQKPTASSKNPAPPADAVAEIFEDGILTGWQLKDGSEVTI